MGFGRNLKNFIKNPILGGFNGGFIGIMHTGQGLISGAWTGLRGGKLKLTNVGAFDKLTKTLGFGIGKTVNATVGRPVVKVAATLTKNTPKDFVQWANRVNNLGTGVKNTFFKKATKEEIEAGEHTLFGYKTRALTPMALTVGAAGYGIAEGAGEADYNLGLQTVVNGMMDTEGVVTTPGAINPTYTPVNRHGVNNHGATGELPLALHKQRTSGYL